VIDRLLGAALSEALGVPLSAATSRRLVRLSALSPEERRRHDGFASPERRREWRRGRAALKLLVGGDTAALRFPHPRLSLSHAAGRAVAVALDGAPPGVVGVGVDLEGPRRPREETARFFLDERERAWLAALAPAERPAELLRLWTVKEALFKADPDNDGGALADYALHAPGLPAGRARRGRRRFRYATKIVDAGTLSVAVAEDDHAH
jgi:phosphopantetheinyl transferase (holo-ACP synthase)